MIEVKGREDPVKSLIHVSSVSVFSLVCTAYLELRLSSVYCYFISAAAGCVLEHLGLLYTS